jgi:hypothetical protein
VKAAIGGANLLPAETRTMIAVEAQFEEMVERDRPATVKQLVAAGRL